MSEATKRKKKVNPRNRTFPPNSCKLFTYPTFSTCFRLLYSESANSFLLNGMMVGMMVVAVYLPPLPSPPPVNFWQVPKRETFEEVIYVYKEEKGSQNSVLEVRQARHVDYMPQTANFCRFYSKDTIQVRIWPHMLIRSKFKEKPLMRDRINALGEV